MIYELSRLRCLIRNQRALLAPGARLFYSRPMDPAMRWFAHRRPSSTPKTALEV